MQLALPREAFERYKSHSQRARIATETWALENLYCVNCESNRLLPSPPNTPAVDFLCPRCDAPFQLKAQSHPFGGRIVDAAYEKMLHAIREDLTPNLLALHYGQAEWAVLNAFVVPRFAFPLSAIEKRRPLAATARRAGWIGCNIVLAKIPLDARIPLIAESRPANPKVVRELYSKIRPLANLGWEKRGWTLDVLNLIRSLRKTEFSLSDAYTLETQLAALHPANRHIRDKIRQQLQVLRDLGLLEFLGGGTYRLRSSAPIFP